MLSLSADADLIDLNPKQYQFIIDLFLETLVFVYFELFACLWKHLVTLRLFK